MRRAAREFDYYKFFRRQARSYAAARAPVLSVCVVGARSGVQQIKSFYKMRFILFIKLYKASLDSGIYDSDGCLTVSVEHSRDVIS